MKFFKPEDFRHQLWLDHGVTSEIANAKLEREGKRVYSVPGVHGPDWTFNKYKYSVGQALLINIEPIEECTHPKEKIAKFWRDTSNGPEFLGYNCLCGARVEPTGFGEIT